MADALRLLVVRAALGLQNATLWLVVRVLFPTRRHSAPPPSRVLVYRTARLGDFINALPALAAVRSGLPAARIALLTTPSTDPASVADIAKSLDGAVNIPWAQFACPQYVDSVITFQREPTRAWLTRLHAEVKAFDPDEIIMVGTALESWRSKLRKLLFFRLIGVRRPIFGWRVRGLQHLFLRAQWRTGCFEHQVVGAIRSVAEHPLLADADEVGARMRVPVNSVSRESASHLFSELLEPDGEAVAIFAGGTFAHKQWPAERFARLCEDLASVIPGLHILLIGGNSDRDVSNEVSSRLQGRVRATDLTGRLKLPDLAAILERCSLYVGNDSGPTHLASAVGCPTVSILSGIELPGSWDPWEHRDFSVRHDVPCAGCYGFRACPTGTRVCLGELPVSRVLQACLAARNAGRTDRQAAGGFVETSVTPTSHRAAEP